MQPVYKQKKERERRPLREFFDDAGPTFRGCNCIEANREQPDFIFERSGQRIGVEVTELLTRESGRERAGERTIADIVHEVVAQTVRRHGGRGAVVDGHLDELPRRRSEAAALAQRFEEHLRKHGAPLAHNHGVVTVPFSFQWGTVSRISRDHGLGRVWLLREPSHRTTLPERDCAWLESQLVATVREKVEKAGG